MDWMDAIANMSNTTSTREFTDNDLIIDMSDFYEDWKPGCATCKDVEKFFDYFCSIVTVLDKDEIRKVFVSETSVDDIIEHYNLNFDNTSTFEAPNKLLNQFKK